VKGVGEKLSILFAKKGVGSVEDLLFYLPRTYEDRRKVLNVSEIQMGTKGVVVGKIARAHPVFYSRSRKRTFEVSLEDVNGKLGSLKLTWFHAPYLAKKLTEGTYVLATGTVQGYQSSLQMVHPDLEVLGLEFGVQVTGQGIVPIYSETAGLYQKTLRKIISQAIKEYSVFVKETLPEEIRVRESFPKMSDALKFLHSPPDVTDMDSLLNSETRYHRRLIYDEFFQLSVAMAMKRKVYTSATGIAFPKPTKFWETFKLNLPFQFTNAQRRAAAEILHDMQLDRPMHRLIQGDVGSGKTVVAAAAALVALEAGYQVALMAPTEILAEQHRKNFDLWFKGLNIESAFLSGSLKAKEKRLALESIASGKAAMVFGTHALFEDEVKFSNLGLVVVDEQHRFGVRQRAALLSKGEKKNHSPDLLVMTATPIPRTLALTVYGDLDFSLIDELPPGRKPIQTKLYRDAERLKLYERIRAELQKGRQAYVVFPLIDESEELKLKSLTEMLPEMKEAFKGFRVEHLHGRMSADDKASTLDKFRAGEIQLLASTTVIEVGVDVPNATVMAVEHAERFGLSQLHQLRGRVGRGAEESYCFLVASHLGTPEIVQRLQSMEQIHDGFKLAEVDLEMRGPGELLGTRQSGVPVFSMARLPRDLSLLQMAKKDAEDLVAKGYEFKDVFEKVTFN